MVLTLHEVYVRALSFPRTLPEQGQVEETVFTDAQVDEAAAFVREHELEIWSMSYARYGAHEWLGVLLAKGESDAPRQEAIYFDPGTAH